MTTVAGNIADFAQKAAKAERQLIGTVITITAAGAIGSEDADDPGVSTVKNGGTGDYTTSFPSAPKGRICSAYIVSAAGTVGQVKVISFDPTTSPGTINFITSNPAGTATNPASGDKIHLELNLQKRL